MHSALIALFPCSLAMVIDYPAFGNPQSQTRGSMMIQSDGELHRINEEIGCLECCKTTFTERNVSWLQAQENSLYATSGGLNVLDLWNHETEAEFSKCGAVTTENVVSSSSEQLFMAWGFLMEGADDSINRYCSKACHGNLSEMTIVHESMIQPLMKSQVTALSQMTKDVDQDVGTHKLTRNMSALEYKAGCSDGCYSGQYYQSAWWKTHGAKGSLCLSGTSSTTMNIYSAKGAASSLGGTCRGVNFQGWANGGRLIGGSGTCGVLGYITHTECAGNNEVIAYLNRSPHSIRVRRYSGLLQLSELAASTKMSIDQLLDHPEYGQHTGNMLLDFYKDSIEAGESLIEMSHKDAQKNKHSLTLENRHVEKAMALHSELPEAWKKRNFVPVGYRLQYKST
jgi:hypothetical protein